MIMFKFYTPRNVQNKVKASKNAFKMILRKNRHSRKLSNKHQGKVSIFEHKRKLKNCIQSRFLQENSQSKNKIIKKIKKVKKFMTFSKKYIPETLSVRRGKIAAGSNG